MFDLTFLIIAFAGGLVGAAFGALPNFIFCGFMAIVGAVIAVATGDNTFSNVVAWGPFFGPHISFAGGAAAAAYAARKGMLASGRDITTALIGLESPSVLLVGGLFGALGYVFQVIFNLIPNIGEAAWTNTIALSIVATAIVARLMFGSTGVFGQVRSGDNRWVPTEAGSWLPWQSHPLQLILIAIGIGLPVAYITRMLPASVGLGFGIVAASLIFLQYGTKVPVTHHIALSAEVVTAITGDLMWGLALALLAVFLGEIYAVLFTAHGDTHIDPPSAALATTGLIIPVLTVSGVLNLSGMASLTVAVAVAVLGYVIMMALRSSQPVRATAV